MSRPRPENPEDPIVATDVKISREDGSVRTVRVPFEISTEAAQELSDLGYFDDPYTGEHP